VIKKEGTEIPTIFTTLAKNRKGDAIFAEYTVPAAGPGDEIPIDVEIYSYPTFVVLQALHTRQHEQQGRYLVSSSEYKLEQFIASSEARIQKELSGSWTGIILILIGVTITLGCIYYYFNTKQTRTRSFV